MLLAHMITTFAPVTMPQIVQDILGIDAYSPDYLFAVGAVRHRHHRLGAPGERVAEPRTRSSVRVAAGHEDDVDFRGA
jgi:hypothetical protein